MKTSTGCGNHWGWLWASLLVLGAVSGCGVGESGHAKNGRDVGPSDSETGRGIREEVSVSSADRDAAGESISEADSERTRTMSREPLFEGWPEPEFVLFLTGQQIGFIEPCGCSGLETALGGLARRSRSIQELSERGWAVVPLDVGNQVRRFGRQPEIKFQMTVAGLKQMGYGAIGFGPDDLRLSVGELLAVTAADSQNDTPFVSANTAIIDRSLTPEFQLIEAGGRRIGVTAVVGTAEQARITSGEIVKLPVEESLQAVGGALEQAECDVRVLLAFASLDESIRIARQFPDFDVVVTSGGAAEPPYQPDTIEETGSTLVQVGAKGMHAVVLGFFNDEVGMRYQRVPLDARFSDDPPMLDLMASYQEQLKVLGLEGLGVQPIPHPSGNSFVGSNACQDCHLREYELWLDTDHSHAMSSLMYPGERGEIPRHYDPECISCHVVGWDPQNHFPYISGYLSLEETPLMQNVGCENCHGPGRAHVDAETMNRDEALMARLREDQRLPLAEAERTCLECHDIDNSPDFHLPGAFERYWERIEH